MNFHIRLFLEVFIVSERRQPFNESMDPDPKLLQKEFRIGVDT